MMRIVIVRCEIESSGTDAELVAAVEMLVANALRSKPAPTISFAVNIDYLSDSIFTGLPDDVCGQPQTVPCIRPKGHDGDCEVSEP